MKAMILAAGRGERMRPLTDHVPKPLLSVGGKPLIVWHIERLAYAGITELVINHAHLGHKIVQALGDGRHWGVQITYSPEETALETAGGIAQALPLLGKEPFLVVNGDIYCDCDFSSVATVGVTGGDVAYLMLVPNPEHHPEGDFSLHGGRVGDGGSLRWTFSGVGVYRRDFFDAVRPGSCAKLAPLLRTAMAQDRVGGVVYQGRWVDVGTPQRLSALDLALSRSAVSY